jgi:hypothetical protein
MEDGRPALTNRLLSRIPFVRTSLEEQRPPADQPQAKEPQAQQKSPQMRRRRKGSLRTTLLSTGHIAASSRNAATKLTISPPKTSEDPDGASSGLKSGSTTDEDGDAITLRARSSSGSYTGLATTIPSTSTPTSSRRGRAAIPSVLPVVGGVSMRATESTAHDYRETEWWGWIILFVTWIVFVVGMGSCLGIWSWAWDVGETPYAPPEFEDDATLPIVGYYPALIVMTGVMAWVWVIVAWVGMKYFRHAKVWDGEEY